MTSLATIYRYLTIFPRAQMGSESIAYEADRRTKWAIASEAMRARGITVLVKTKQLVKNIETKHLQLVKFRLNPFLFPKSRRFSLLLSGL